MSNHQALVIGLGQFGMSLARALAAHGTEVLAVDRREQRVRTAAAFAAEAIEMDASDEEHLARLSPERRDVCVCAIGDDAREASILVTAMLRQMGARRVLSRATDDLHERILRLVGAHEVVNPERIFGERLATRLTHRGVVDMLPLGDDLEITELAAPPGLLGRRLSDLALPRQFQVTVVALRRTENGQGRLLLPDAETRIGEGDVMVLVGPKGASNRLVERLS
jgi:trk system potassium uptake protein TrkA